MHHLIDRIEDRLRIGFGPVIAVGAVRGAMLRAGQRVRGGIEPVVAALLLDDFLQHVGRRAARHIFIDEKHAAGLFERFDDLAVKIERQQRLHVDRFRLRCQPRSVSPRHPGRCGSMRRR